jgi:hypothetical protein
MPKTARPVNVAPAEGGPAKRFNRPDDPRAALI